MSVKVIDNFLSPSQYHELTSLIMAPDFCWSFQDSVIGGTLECREDYNYQFIHCFHIDLEQTSPSYKLLMRLFFDKLGVRSIVRIKANLNTQTEKNIIHGFHTDVDFLCKTAVYYVNSNNGFTIFDNGEKVDSVANRMVIFNSNKKHSGSTCTDQKRRVVINFNYF